MPYELGVFMGCKHFGSNIHKKKDFLVIDRKPHRYKILISDLAGYDFPPYSDVNSLIEVIRNWLVEKTSAKIAGPLFHQKRYQSFLEDLPFLCEEEQLNVNSLSFKDYSALVSAWIFNENRLLVQEGSEESEELIGKL